MKTFEIEPLGPPFDTCRGFRGTTVGQVYRIRGVKARPRYRGTHDRGLALETLTSGKWSQAGLNLGTLFDSPHNALGGSNVGKARLGVDFRTVPGLDGLKEALDL